MERATFEQVMERMLAQAPSDIDTREGSVIWNALAPVAIEVANMYIELEQILNETFADTASRDFLIRRAAERGIAPVPQEPTCALLRGESNALIPLGSRFLLGDLYYEAVERLADGGYKMRCETAGTVGNKRFGEMTPVAYIAGLTSARLTALLVPGEEPEQTESLRRRYIESFRNQSYGFNRAQYIAVAGALAGVGGVKVYRAWKGPGTVRLVITDSDFHAPTDLLVEMVQRVIDPLDYSGEGLGLASIDHMVTVEGVRERAVDVRCRLVFEQAVSPEGCRAAAEKAIDQYFDELNRSWQDSPTLLVRIAQIETRILQIPGILDISGTTVNGSFINLELLPDEIVRKGVFTDEQQGD